MSFPVKCEHAARVQSIIEGRTGDEDARVSDMQYMMEALHGHSAPLMAVAIACDMLVDGQSRDAEFWMKVYRALLSSAKHDAGPVLH